MDDSYGTYGLVDSRQDLHLTNLKTRKLVIRPHRFSSRDFQMVTNPCGWLVIVNGSNGSGEAGPKVEHSRKDLVWTKKRVSPQRHAVNETQLGSWQSGGPAAERPGYQVVGWPEGPVTPRQTYGMYLLLIWHTYGVYHHEHEDIYERGWARFFFSFSHFPLINRSHSPDTPHPLLTLFRPL